MTQAVEEEFHKKFYTSINWRNDIRFLGVPILKNPLDLFSIQEIIVRCNPNVIIETGTAFGGSALFYSTIFEGMGSDGEIISIDVKKADYVDKLPPGRYNINYLIGDSASEQTLGEVQQLIKDMSLDEPRIMVILDSDHTFEHVSKEIHFYSPLVSPGQYLIVEDTNTGLVLPEYDEGRGAGEAVSVFKASHKYQNVSVGESGFLEDWSVKVKWGFSFNTYLKKDLD